VGGKDPKGEGEVEGEVGRLGEGGFEERFAGTTNCRWVGLGLTSLSGMTGGGRGFRGGSLCGS
jgi:hypothetical protein